MHHFRLRRGVDWSAVRNRTVGVKAGAGVGLVLLTTLIFFAASSCDNCDASTISASGVGDSTTSTLEAGAVQNAPITPRGAIDGTPSSLGILTGSPAGLNELLVLDAAQGLTTTTPEGAEGTDSTEVGDGSSTTVVGGSTTDGSTADTPTTVPPTTQATSAAPLPAPPSDGGAPPVNGQVFYVSANSGNDGNDGLSTSSPWRSLQSGIKRLQAGQTLLVMDGDYRELKVDGQVHYSVDRGGSSGNWIRIANAPGHNPVIVASRGTGILVQAPYVEVSGLRVRGSGFSQSNNWGIGISVTDTHNVRVVGNRISDMPLSGISIVDSSKFQIIGNDVSNNSFWSPLQGSGISIWHSRNKGQGADSDGYHNRIIGNRVYGNENKVKSSHKNYEVITDGNGIIVDSTQETGYSGRTLIANNLVYDNGGRGVIIWKADRVDVLFNTAYQNGQTDGIAGGAAELAAGRSNDIKIANNVGWARSGLPAIIFDAVSNGRSYSNVLVSDSPSGHASGDDIIHSGNPGFRNASTNPGSADFRPNSNSVLKGRSTNAPGFIGTDLVGTSRRNGTPDIGAFEAEAGRR